MTPAEMNLFTLDLVGETSETPKIFNAARMNRFLTQAVQEVYNQILLYNADHFHTESTTYSPAAGTRTLSLPDDFIRLIALKQTDGSSDRDIRVLGSEREAKAYRGSSEVCYLQADSLVFLRDLSGTATYVITYDRSLPDVDISSGDPYDFRTGPLVNPGSIPTTFHPLICYYAAWYAALMLKQETQRILILIGDAKTKLSWVVGKRQLASPSEPAPLSDPFDVDGHLGTV